MSLNTVNAFWARLSVSGRVLPPLTKSDSLEVLTIVENNPQAIGYVDNAVLPAQKVIAVLQLHE